MIIVDLNIHLEKSCSNSKSFHSLIESLDLTQKVNFPTHIHGHTLDLVLTKSNDDNISYVRITDAFSYHFSISFTLNLSTPRSQTEATVTFCKYHKIKMKIYLLASELNPLLADTMYNQYHSTLSGLTDKHAQPHAKHV